MRPDFKLNERRGIQEAIDRDASLAFDSVEGGVVQKEKDNKRRRAGRVPFNFFAEKVEGTFDVSTPSGATGGGKGMFIWVDPDPTVTNRSRVIYALNDNIYLYSVTNDTTVLLRAIGGTDVKTISFLSGVQSKQYAYIAIGDSTLTTTWFRYDGTTSGTIASAADYGGTVAGTVKFTDVAHGMQTGNTVTIAGTTSYNGTYTITRVDNDNFYVTVTWVSDQTGTWTGETLIKDASVTALNAPKILGFGENRIASIGTGFNTTKPQYSYVSTTGLFVNFTASTNVDEGGLFSGIETEATDLQFFRGSYYIFEKNRITPHVITNYDEALVGRIKDTQTMKQDFVIDGTGVNNAKSVSMHEYYLYWVNQNGLYGYNAQKGVKLLTEEYKTMFNEYDFSDCSLTIHPEEDLLIIMARTQDDTPNNIWLCYSLNTQHLSFLPNRYQNQMKWDPVNKKMFATCSNEPKLQQVFTSYFTDDNDEFLEFEVETRMNNMGDEYKKKSFVSLSQKVGFTDTSQVFDYEIYIDDQDAPIATFSRNTTDVISATSVGLPAYASEAGAGGNPDDITAITWGTVFWRGFVPHFQKISIRVKENSPFRCLVYQPVVRFRTTNEKVNSFTSTS